MISATLVALLSAAPPSLHAELRASVPEPEARALEATLKKVAAQLQAKLASVDACTPAQVTARLEGLVTSRLQALHEKQIPLDARRIERQVIGAEAFAFETFVNTGIRPKRYFGYLDEAQDTAAYETRLKVAAAKSATVCNRWLAAKGSRLRVTEAELIVTFLAEGGAVLLRERQAELESIHPVQGIGLDDIAKGFGELEPLLRLLDAEVGTKLLSIVDASGPEPRLTRNFHFEEAIAGTAAMWVWEKQRAEAKLLAQGRPSLATRPLDEQFVIGSLVYNSGLLFEQKTIDGVGELRLGSYLFDVSESSKARRWALPVLPPKGGLKLLLGGGDYPEQLTTWSTVFHVLQRYGAMVELNRYGDVFDSAGGVAIKSK